MKELTEIIYEEYDKLGISPTNTEDRLIRILGTAIEKWITDELSVNTRKWLIEYYEPAKLKFLYNMILQFPTTFETHINKELNIKNN